jgi:hypothetical protein
MFLSSYKIKSEIVGFGKKKFFWKLVPYVEVTLVSKFHLIWCPIAQESSLGRKGRIMGENHVSRYLPADNVRSHRTMFDLQFEFSEISHRTMFGPTGQYSSDNFSPMFIHYFGCILLTECSFDPIFLPLAS